MPKEIQSFDSFHVGRFLHLILQEKGHIVHWLNRMSGEYKHITKTKKRHLIILLTLLGTMPLALAQTREDWSGTVNGRTLTANTVYNVRITGDVYLTGPINMNTGTTLKITTTGDYTIRRASNFSGEWFFKSNGDDARPNLQMDGGAYSITLDGGAVYSTPNDATSGLTNSPKTGRAIWCNGGLTLNNVVVQNFYRPNESGFIDLDLRYDASTYNCTLTNCTIQGNYGGSMFYMESQDNHNAILKNVTFQYNDATHGEDPYGACIRTNGSVRSSLTIKDCKLLHNKVQAGAIHWNALGRATTVCNIYGNTEIAYNECIGNTGGVYNCANMNISSADIHDNIAALDGGGIRMSTYVGGTAGYTGEGYSLTITDSVKVYNNRAGGYGGGICLEFGPSADVGYNTSGNAIDAHFHLQVTGGEIYNNYAPVGGGICIRDFAPKKVKYNNKWSGEYIRNVEITGGKIYGNYTWAGANTGSSDNEHGGAFGIVKNNNDNITYTDDFGTLTVDMSGGEIYQNTAYNGSGSDANTGCGGAFFIMNDFASGKTSNCNVNVSGTVQLYGNSAENNGAGIYLNGGNFTMTGGTIGKDGTTLGKTNHNVASQDGGGFYIKGGSCSIQGGTISYNDADRNGGGFYVDPGSSTATNINSSSATTNINNNTAVDGAGAYVASGTLVIASAATNIHHNTASNNGGGLYVDPSNNGRTALYNGATVSYNTATNQGGGLYVHSGNVDVNVNDTIDFKTGDLSQGVWTNDATYPWFVTTDGNPNGDSYCMKSGNGGVTFGSNNNWSYSNISSTIFFEGGGTISFRARISSETNYDYGYFYIDDVQQFEISGDGGWIDYSYAVNAGYHTFRWTYKKDWKDDRNDDSFYVDNIIISYTLANTTVNLTNNESTTGAGGGLYAGGGNVNLNNADISSNQASTDGGGIYAEGGVVTVNNSTINNNYAAEKGGGLYIPSTGMLNLTGTTTLAGNHVPYGKLGGGVYLLGTVQAGNSSSDAINVSTNYAGNSYEYEEGGANTRNNIYLPNPTDTPTTPDSWPTVITVVNNGLDLNNSSIGFSVPHNFVPVIYCQTASYLSSTLINSNVIFEDSDRYTQKYYADNQSAGYYPNFIYLSADTWVQAVTSQPATGFSVDGSGNVTISTKEGLAWLISYVNGLNSVEGDAHDMSGKTVTLTADVDMKAHIWVPIGMNASDAPKTFKGTFNGNGHTISNIYCSYLGDLLVGGTGRGLGMFGTTDGATIHDVFLHGVELDVHGQTGSDAYVMGSIVNEAKGSTSIYNCIADATMVSTMANTTMGGLVGKLTSGTIHSTAAMPKMTGYQMGGIVGELTSGGNLYNSFANALFTAQSGSNKYMGGLVGVNAGRIENCYSRLQNTSNPSDTYFGWIAGQNNSGTITYCYMPVNNYGATYVKNGTAADNKCTTYGPTSIPYLYKHADNQMTTNSNNDNIVNGALDRNGLKGLLATLNKWVGNSNTYSKWMRTCASPINDDYPIHNYSNYVCVGSKDNILLEYDADFNAKFHEYVSANIGNIFLYQSPSADVTSSLSNSGKATELYIHEDVVMMHTSTIKAHVGITIDNTAGTGGANPSFHINPPDAIDWHFFSSALADAPIGLVYGDQDLYEAYHYPTWQANFTASNAVNGYFPITDFSNNNYYFDWDLYAYHEPDYHWINLKRNSASHWHEDYPDTHIYPYTNDTEFVPGRGYMVALKDEGYLQGYGTLNTNSGENDDFLSVPVSYTPEIAWTTREGHNLLGNPYQSYLDFNKFATDAENATLWNEGRDPFYIIMDEDKQDYVIYTMSQSKNTEQASRYLHPHQGFMIDVDKNGSARFCNAMRTTTLEGSWTGDFRDDSQPDYPLVNLMATDGYGNRDIVTVELGRPDKGGALKQDAWRTGKGSLWCRYEDEDYALVFTQPGLEYANIRFACDEDGEYTMTWNTQNGEFSYLHLIDNIMGTDIDCLSKSEYKFTAHASDYNSRFRLMFDYTGIDENGEDGPSTGLGTDTAFAFIMNGELVVNGTGIMQLIDLNGRMLTNYNINDTQSTVALPDIPAGLYVLRLITENGTRTQKIILD
jgi:hypothetical protein